MYTPVNPSSIIQKWGVRGSLLYGLVYCDVKNDYSKYLGCLKELRKIRECSSQSNNAMEVYIWTNIVDPVTVV